VIEDYGDTGARKTCAVLCTVSDMVCYPQTAQVLPRPDS